MNTENPKYGLYAHEMRYTTPLYYPAAYVINMVHASAYFVAILI